MTEPTPARPLAWKLPAALGAVALVAAGVAYGLHSRPEAAGAGAAQTAAGAATGPVDAATTAATADTRGQVEVPRPATSAAPSGPGPEAPPTDTTPTQPAPPGAARGPATPTAPGRLVPKLTDSGWDIYEVPVGPDDHALGPADAPVTYVAFMDFESAPCRYLETQVKPLEARYGDKVRFVFKHYPLNADCNPRMGTARTHDGACRAARAAICAGEQGRFWELHDELYRNQGRLSDDALRGYAAQVGVDVARWQQCYKSQRPQERIRRDVELAAGMRVHGTPRIYIHNRLVTGSTTTEVLDYYLRLALDSPPPPPTAAARAATVGSPRMVAGQASHGTFWIDAFEASVDKHGKALSVPGVQPARASWYDAKAACELAGKRLCSEEEWVSACIGAPAVDDDSNGRFVDGPVRGRLYPYGAYYEVGACRDDEDERSGDAGRTGDSPRCRTAEGLYDLAGNLGEWVGLTETDAALLGGDSRSGAAATCRQRTATYGPGLDNAATGFRCCADSRVKDVGVASDAVDTRPADVIGRPVPTGLALETSDGRRLGPATFAGKVTLLTFFASWSAGSRQQVPVLKAWQDEWRARGFQVVAINLDRTRAKGEQYVRELAPNFAVAYDPMARATGGFDIDALPTSFLVGRDGRITRRVLKDDDGAVEQTRAAIRALLLMAPLH